MFVLQKIKVKLVQVMKLCAQIKPKRIGISLIKSDKYYCHC